MSIYIVTLEILFMGKNVSRVLPNNIWDRLDPLWDPEQDELDIHRMEKLKAHLYFT